MLRWNVSIFEDRAFSIATSRNLVPHPSQACLTDPHGRSMAAVPPNKRVVVDDDMHRHIHTPLHVYV